MKKNNNVNHQAKGKSPPPPRRLEKILRPPFPAAPGTIEGKTPQEVFQDLQTHRLELEMQNQELKRIQLELEESRSKYFDLYDCAPVGYFTLTKDALVSGANLTGADLFGTAPAALVKSRFRRLVSPDDLDRWDQHFVGVLQNGGKRSCELALRRTDGTTFHALLSSLRVKIPPDQAGLDGGGAWMVRVAVTDVTDRKQAEAARDRAENELRQSQKMEAIGRLAGGVAHDFNNMLGVILGYTDLILARLAPLDPLARDVREIKKAAERSAELTRQLLAFSRKQVVAPRVVDLNRVIDGQQQMLGRLIGEDIVFRFAPAPHLWNILADPSQVELTLANLVVNARDAIAGPGKIVIETSNASVDHAYAHNTPGAAPGDYVLLTISDTGSGMDKPTMDRIFEPFFTTKGEGKGTGLGLSMVYGIVRQHGGFVDVYSSPGMGTTFKVYFPRCRDQASAPDQPFEKEALAGSETVLVVEDEEQILSMAQAILEQFGYKVLAARSPGDALQLVEKHPGEIHLLLTDVVMPGINGKELSERIVPLKPGIRTIFMSGYTADIIANRGVLEQGVEFIQKPFSLKALAAKVRQVLDS